MKTLQPIPLPPQKIIDRLDAAILTIIYEVIYKPIKEGLKREKIRLDNSLSYLTKAFNNKSIFYVNGVILGKFNSTVGKELRKLGAKYDKRIKGYRIDKGNLPPNLQVIITNISIAQQAAAEKVIGIIDQIKESDIDRIIDNSDFETEYRNIISYTDRKFKSTVEDKIAVKPDITPSMKQLLAEGYSNNVKLPIKGFVQDQIPILRNLIQENAFTGFRSNRLVDIIQDRFSVTESKARLLARQETSLIMSKYKEGRYKDVGITKYMWSTSQDERVRCSHAILNKTIQLWSSPPIVDRKTGRTAHPGEDFFCRCQAVPII